MDYTCCEMAGGRSNAGWYYAYVCCSNSSGPCKTVTQYVKVAVAMLAKHSLTLPTSLAMTFVQ